MFKKILIMGFMSLILASKTSAIELKTMDGQTLNLDQISSDLIVINFWAVWCKPCVQEIPELNKVYKKFENQSVTFLAVSVGREKNLIENFLKKTSIDFTVAIDDSQSLADFYKVSAMPTTILIDKKQNILFKYQGFSRKEISNLEKIIEQKLNNKE